MLIASDVVAIVVGMVVATVIQQLVEPVPDFILRDEALFAAIMVPIWVLMMGANHLFLARAVSQFAEEMRHLLMAGLMSVGFLLAVLFIAQYGELSRLWVGLLFVCVTASLVDVAAHCTAGLPQAASRWATPSAGDHRRDGWRRRLAAPRNATPTRSRLRGAGIHR